MKLPGIGQCLLLLALAGGLATCPMLTESARAQDDEPKDEDPPRRPSSGSSGSGSSGSDTGEPAEHRLSETETAYTGAVILEGGTDITMGQTVVGEIGDESIRRDARFIGNTLYAEATDDDGNTVSMIAEFYWFESSVPRGSDFYVAVVKARTSPNLADDWALEHSPSGTLSDMFRPDRGAVLYVRSTTGHTLSDGAFRWDWSLPFRNYGMDSYGTVRMEANYGAGLMGNGAAQRSFQRDVHGVDVELDGQATGFFDNKYQVNTNYEVTLFRWDVFTNNSGRMLEWGVFLRTSDRRRQIADHQFFIAMQADAEQPFHLDSLEVGGHVVKVRDWLPNIHEALSVRVNDIVITRPANAGMTTRDDEDTRPWDRGDDPDADEDDEDNFDWPEAEPLDAPAACSTVAPGTESSGLGWLLMGFTLVLIWRRK